MEKNYTFTVEIRSEFELFSGLPFGVVVEATTDGEKRPISPPFFSKKMGVEYCEKQALEIWGCDSENTVLELQYAVASITEICEEKTVADIKIEEVVDLAENLWTGFADFKEFLEYWAGAVLIIDQIKKNHLSLDGNDIALEAKIALHYSNQIPDKEHLKFVFRDKDGMNTTIPFFSKEVALKYCHGICNDLNIPKEEYSSFCQAITKTDLPMNKTRIDQAVENYLNFFEEIKLMEMAGMHILNLIFNDILVDLFADWPDYRWPNDKDNPVRSEDIFKVDFSGQTNFQTIGCCSDKSPEKIEIVTMMVNNHLAVLFFADKARSELFFSETIGRRQIVNLQQHYNLTDDQVRSLEEILRQFNLPEEPTIMDKAVRRFTQLAVVSGKKKMMTIQNHLFALIAIGAFPSLFLFPYEIAEMQLLKIFKNLDRPDDDNMLN